MNEIDACKGCGVKGKPLCVSGSQREPPVEWHDLYLCPVCMAKYRKEHNIKSLREIEEELKKKHGVK